MQDENEINFLKLVQCIAEGIGIVDENEIFIFANKAAAQIFEVPHGTLVGRSLNEFLTKNDLEFIKDQTQKRKSGDTSSYELCIITAAGNTKVIDVTVSPNNDSAGNYISSYGVFRDITNIKEYKKELAQKQIELERSNNDLEQFAYTVSHDLQEPLRMISSFTDLLRKKYSEKLDEQGLSYINFTVEGAKRMQNLIQGLLTYSRISTQANPFELTELRDPLNIALINLSMALKESSAEIIIGDLPKVYADKYQISSVFLNLISNAVKFRKENEKLIIEINSRELKEQNMFEISVKDNGIGIDRKHFENIFLIFHRLHSQDKYPGTGIGLSVCKRIIERHGGSIKVESGTNAGTTFFFTLKTGE